MQPQRLKHNQLRGQDIHGGGGAGGGVLGPHAHAGESWRQWQEVKSEGQRPRAKCLYYTHSKLLGQDMHG
eukprot:6036092-Lingulodinium_polyedra.AAC.1